MLDMKIAISAILSANAEKDLQKELDVLSKKLKLSIQNVSLANQKLTSSSGSTESATNKAAQAMGRYEKGLANLIHLYQMKEVSDRKFIDTMEHLRGKTEFTTLTWQKQEQVIKLLAQAEKNYQKVSDEGTKIGKSRIDQLHQEALAINKKIKAMDEAHAKAIIMNKEFNKQKIDIAHKEALVINKKITEEREKVLQFEQKIRAVIEKQNETIKRRDFNYGGLTTGVNASTFGSKDSFSSYIRQQYGESAEIIGKFNDKQLKTGEIITQANFRVKEGNDKWRMYQATLNKTTGEMRMLDNGLKDVIHRQLSFGEATKIATTRIFQWGMATSAVYGSLGFFRESVVYITQLDNSLNEIRIVTNKTQEEVNSLAKSYNDLAKEMNVTTKELAATSADLYRQGLTDSEVEERMKAIVQYAKISAISLGDASKIITATANATGESVQKIIDIFALLGDETASGAEEIGESLQRVASAAKNSNISLEKSASWIATISSITRESASTIGRSLNSIISRYESIKKTGFNQEDATQINDVTKALASVGIVALDSQGQLRDFAEIVDLLGAKFDTLSKNEKSYITTTLFGTYQRNRGLTLLNNYNYSLENYEKALNSAGAAQEKFNIYQESSQAIIDEFTATVEGLQDKFISSDFLKDSIKAGTEFLNIIDRITTGLGGLNTVLLLLVTGTLVRYTSLLYSIAKGATITQTALVGLSLGVKGLSTALLGLLTNPVTWLITALVAIPAGILLWTNHNQKLLEQQKALTKAQNDFNKTLKEFSNTLDSSKIDELKNKLEALKEASNYEENIEKIKELKKEIEELENRPTSLRDDGTELNQKRIELGKLEEKIKDVTEAEKEYNKQVEISKALDYESQQNIVRKIASKVREIQSEKDLIEQYEKSIKQGKEDLELKKRLIEKYPEHIRYLDDQKTKLEINTEAIKNNKDMQILLAKAEIIEAQSAMRSSYEKTNQILEDTQTRIELMKIEKTILDGLVESRGNFNKLAGIDNPVSSIFEKRSKGIDDAIRQGELTTKRLKETLSIQKAFIEQTPDELLKAYSSSVDPYKPKIETPPPKSKSYLEEIFRATATYNEEIKDTLSNLELLEKQVEDLEYNIKVANILGDEEKSIELQRELVELTKQRTEALESTKQKIDEIQDRVNRDFKSQFGSAFGDKLIGDLSEVEKSNFRQLIQSRITDYKNALKKAQIAEDDALAQSIEKQIKKAENYLADFDFYDALSGNIIKSSEQLGKDIGNSIVKGLEQEKAIDDYFKKKNEDLLKQHQERLKFQQDLGIYLINKEIEKLQEQKNALREIAELQIQFIQDQIDALEARNDLLNEEETRTQKLIDLTKQRQKLENIKNERNVKMINADGSISWIANPKLVQEETERLEQMQTDYFKWEEDLRRKKEIQQLKDQIKAIQDNLKEQEKGFDKQISNLQNFIKAYQDSTSEFYNKAFEDLDKFITDIKGLENLSYEQRLAALSNFVSQYNALVNSIKTAPSVPTATPISSTSPAPGYNVTEYSDGSKTASSPSGTTLFYNPNGSIDFDKSIIKKYHEGGEIGKPTKETEVIKKLFNLKGDEIPIIAQEGEFMLSKSMTRNFIPNMQKLFSGIKPTTTSNNNTSKILHINIAKLETPNAMSFINDLEILVHQNK